MIKNGPLYDKLKFLAQVVLPALAALYAALALTWGWDNSTQVVGTIVALDAFLGVVLQISTTVYNNSGAKYDGTVNVIDTPKKKTFSLDINGDPFDIENKDEVVFKVNSGVSPAAKKQAARKKRSAAAAEAERRTTGGL